MDRFGDGRQIQELLELLRNKTLTTEGKFEDVLLAQLGKIGQIALDLEAIAQINQQQANELAQQLDAAQRDNDAERFNALTLQIEVLAAEARQ